MATKTFLTVEDYLRLDEPEAGENWELSDGELIVTPSTTLSHNRIRDEIHAQLRGFVRARESGEASAEIDVQLGPATVRRPDVAYWTAERMRGVDPDRVPMPPPNLVVEVLSKHDRPGAVRRKVEQYLAAGVEAVWLIDPQAREAHRFRPGQAEPEVRGVDGQFEEPGLLPGFCFPLSQVL